MRLPWHGPTPTRIFPRGSTRVVPPTRCRALSAGGQGQSSQRMGRCRHPFANGPAEPSARPGRRRAGHRRHGDVAGARHRLGLDRIPRRVDARQPFRMGSGWHPIGVHRYDKCHVHEPRTARTASEVRVIALGTGGDTAMEQTFQHRVGGVGCPVPCQLSRPAVALSQLSWQAPELPQGMTLTGWRVTRKPAQLAGQRVPARVWQLDGCAVAGRSTTYET